MALSSGMKECGGGGSSLVLAPTTCGPPAVPFHLASQIPQNLTPPHSGSATIPLDLETWSPLIAASLLLPSPFLSFVLQAEGMTYD